MSWGAYSTQSAGTPSSFATICGNTVFVPWPISVCAVRTRIRPSAVSSTEATDARYTSPEPVKPAPCHASASPMPVAPAMVAGAQRAGRDGARAAALRRAPARSRSRTRSKWLAATRLLEDLLAGDALAQHLAGRGGVVDPVDVAPPQLGRAQVRARSAIRFSCVSAANSVCGAPKPRNAPFGRRVRPRRPARSRTFGQRYGPPAWSSAARQHDGRERAVRAAVHDDLDVLGDEPAVAW